MVCDAIFQPYLCLEACCILGEDHAHSGHGSFSQAFAVLLTGVGRGQDMDYAGRVVEALEEGSGPSKKRKTGRPEVSTNHPCSLVKWLYHESSKDSADQVARKRRHEQVDQAVVLASGS